MSFRWRGKNYSFRCLPFGLSLSPMFITKLYRHMVEHLQQQGHQIIMYIDDILIVGATRDECRRSVSAVLTMLEELGAVVNKAKCSLTPSQSLEYLGFLIDSKAMTLTAPERKISNLVKGLKKALRRPSSARDLASLLGKLNSLADAMLPVRVHTSALHQQQLRLLAKTKSWDHTSPLPQAAIDDAQWWLRNLRSLNGRCIIPPKTDLTAATDASDFGWGAWVDTPQGRRSWGGLFTEDTVKKHINYKELLTILYFLKSCPVPLRDKVVDLGVDKTTALAYVQKLGGIWQKPRIRFFRSYNGNIAL